MYSSVLNRCRQMDATKQGNLREGRGKSMRRVGGEVDLFCSTLFILRGHNNDQPGFVLSVIIIDLVF